VGLQFNSFIKEWGLKAKFSWHTHKREILHYYALLVVPIVKAHNSIFVKSQNGGIFYSEEKVPPTKKISNDNVLLKAFKSKVEGKFLTSNLNTKSLTNEERKTLIITLTSSLDKFENATESLSEEQSYFKAREDKWSIAECIEHVTLAEIHFSQILEEEMKKPPSPDERKKVNIKDEQIRSRMLNNIWRATSPEIFRPTGTFKKPKDALITFRDQRLHTILYVQTTMDDLRNHFWKHPLTGTIDLYQTLILMSAHLERHIGQIEKIKENRNYPL
jgi:hypothetical protein